MPKPKLRSWSSFLVTVSGISLVALLTLTDPSSNILYSIFFFLLAFIFLLNLSYFFTKFLPGSLSNKVRRRIIIVASFIIISLMFSSVGSLNWASALSLILIGTGLSFYWDRRAG